MRRDFSEIPANKFFDFRLVSRSAEQAEIQMPVKPEYLQEKSVVHGGVITALADSTAVYILYPELEDGQSMTSIEFKMNFLSPALPGNAALNAVAKLVRRGKRIALCDVEVFQESRLIAKGLFTYLIFHE